MLLPAKGCIFRSGTAPKQAGKLGFYRVDRLSGASPKGYILIESIHQEDPDIVMPMVGLDRQKIIYVFGQDFKTVSVSGVVLAGPDHQPVPSITLLRTWFDSNRISRWRAGVNYSSFNSSGRLYPVKLIEGKFDSTFNTQDFEIQCLAV